MKCIWRNVKLMPERVNELDYDALLLEIHDFMITLPTAWWATRPSGKLFSPQLSNLFTQFFLYAQTHQ